MRRVIGAAVVALALTACGDDGRSEEDALADVREHVVSDRFGGMSDEELTHFMRDLCRNIDEDGIYAVQEIWVGLAWSAGDVGSFRDDLILMSGNAVLTYCPEHRQAFADYRDGSWADQYEDIHAGG